VGISLKPEHLKRYKDIVLLLLKHGRSDLVKRAGLEGVAVEDLPKDAELEKGAKAFVDDLERMGPTFVKLGQLLSSRADLLPPEYLAELARLQDDVEAVSFDEVERTVSSELGVRISKAFASFESTPLASASLGQVHRATLRDGRLVAVKVQRSGVREVIVDDLDALDAVAEFLDAHTEAGRVYEFRGILENLRRGLLAELDYRQEAHNLKLFRENLSAYERILIPPPVDDYSTSRVLTMDFVTGKKVTAIGPLGRLDIDGPALASELFDAYLHQILVDGIWHADPHPGNVFLTDAGEVALIDLGMVARIAPGLQENLLQLLLAIADGKGEEAAAIAVKMGERRSDYDEVGYRERVSDLVARNRDARLANIDVGNVVLEVSHSSGACGVRLPSEFTMFGKTLLSLDQVVKTLDPDFDPTRAIREHAAGLMGLRLLKSASPANLFTKVLEVKDFTERLPGRVNRLLDMAANNDFVVKVDAIDETVLMEGLQKVANRITLGLVLAALIIGAAMLMRIETTFTIFGYPGLAILLFLAAAGGGILLVFNIILNDQTARRKKSR
jgi:predicted unusual protein kinase regulating ubiquinone biosynthesis (AarF/ABC1/UbiB family)